MSRMRRKIGTVKRSMQLEFDREIKDERAVFVEPARGCRIGLGRRGGFEGELIQLRGAARLGDLVRLDLTVRAQSQLEADPALHSSPSERERIPEALADASAYLRCIGRKQACPGRLIRLILLSWKIGGGFTYGVLGRCDRQACARQGHGSGCQSRLHTNRGSDDGHAERRFEACVRAYVHGRGAAAEGLGDESRKHAGVDSEREQQREQRQGAQTLT